MRLLLRLLVNLLRLLILPLKLVRRTRVRRARQKGRTFVTLELDGELPDVAQPQGWRRWLPRRRPTVTLHGVAGLVDAMIEDEAAPGLILLLRALGGRMATATSLRTQVGRLRAAGRVVVVVLPFGADTRTTYVAMAGSRVVAGPTTSVAPVGFAAHVRYLRRALDQAGVLPDVLACGTFKSAGETLTRDTMSDAQREQLHVLLESCFDELLASIATGRSVDRERARALVDGAPYTAEAAQQAGLIDDVAYEDQLPELLGTTAADLVPASRYLAERRPLFRPLRDPPVLGVVRVHGAITLSGQGMFPVASEEPLVETLRQARRDPRVRGVILHVDSPGGSALASERIHRELVRLAADKPLVCCMANVAASGGYYVAAPAHRIVAEPTTITGSIGVVSARVSVTPLLERLGVTTSSLRFGAHSGLLDPLATLDTGERAAVLREMDGIYATFLARVASGRRLDLEAVRAVAEGRVWTGRDALRVGLVDELGGFDVALAALRRLTGGVKLEARVLTAPRHALGPFAPEPSRSERKVTRVLEELLGVDTRLLLAGRRERALLLADVPYVP